MRPFGAILLAAAAMVTACGGAASDYRGFSYKVGCSATEMRVEMVKPADVKRVYLEHLKNYPDERCRPKIESDRITFSISLKDIYRCVVQKVENKGTGRLIYYHRIVLEHEEGPKGVVLVKCDTSSNATSSAVEEVKLVKRAAMPQFENFREQEVEITGEVTGRAPIPELIVGVTQNALLIDEDLTVKPGTPLQMSIELDRLSSDIYGVMVSNMEVTDTREQEEILILNGCTVDPYLFQNFETSDEGNSLRAQFKAFKFPESNFVLFKGTVNVCLDKCGGVECANGQIGFGRRRRRRRRRDVTDVGDAVDRNKVYEVSMSTIVKVAEEHVEGKPATWVEKATLREIYHPDEAALAALSEEFGAYKYIDFQEDSAGRNGGGRTTDVTAALALLGITLVALLDSSRAFV